MHLSSSTQENKHMVGQQSTSQKYSDNMLLHLKSKFSLVKICPECTQKYISTLKAKETQNKNLRYCVETTGSPLGEQG